MSERNADLEGIQRLLHNLNDVRNPRKRCSRSHIPFLHFVFLFEMPLKFQELRLRSLPNQLSQRSRSFMPSMRSLYSKNINTLTLVNESISSYCKVPEIWHFLIVNICLKTHASPGSRCNCLAAKLKEHENYDGGQNAHSHQWIFKESRTWSRQTFYIDLLKLSSSIPSLYLLPHHHFHISFFIFFHRIHHRGKARFTDLDPSIGIANGQACNACFPYWSFIHLKVSNGTALLTERKMIRKHLCTPLSRLRRSSSKTSPD